MPDNAPPTRAPHVPPVLILGAGINGAALARELALSGVSVVVVDTGDLARGATAYSSRLIHGGLRYLEYGEFDLVRESLAERTRLLRLAPQLVRPLRLFIPVSNRFGGLRESAVRFLKLRRAATGSTPHRGLWLVRAGLKLYDWYARDPMLPKHQVVSAFGPDAPPVDRERYPWLCAYYDAQIRYPERLVVAFFDDARRLAQELGASFQLLTYHRAELTGSTVTVRPVAGHESSPRSEAAIPGFQPAAIINATGAWVDHTLRDLHVPSETLMGGTKGSHFVSSNSALREALRRGGIYVEAPDGRPVFILPFGASALVGTTDLPFSGNPADVVASEDELQYLLTAAQRVLPDLGLTRDDIDLHYSGVRPLPRVDEATTGAITRRHWLKEHEGTAIPTFSVIGGKLTTCRSLAESSVATIRARLGFGPPSTTSRDRVLPGGERYPANQASLDAEWRAIAERAGLSLDHVRAVWELRGTQADEILSNLETGEAETIADTDLPRGFVRWILEREWVTTLDDLVERRLMLLYDGRLTQTALHELAALMVEAGLMGDREAELKVRHTMNRLHAHFGKTVALKR